MAKSRNRAADLAVYLAVRVAVAVVQTLPASLRERLADGLARLAYRLDRRHRVVADENLAHAYPELDNAGRDRIVREMYRHLCGLAVDIAVLPRKFKQNTWKQWLDLSGLHPALGEVTRPGKPVLLVTGHFGNWEVASYLLGLSGFPSHAIARTLDNPYLEHFFKGFRQATGQTILAKKGDFDDITGVLASGGVLCTVADQDAGARGQFVPFFGRPASTHKAVALMALEFDAAVVVLGTPRVPGPSRYALKVAAVLHPADYAGRRDAVAELTADYTAALERLIRRHPEQYFWLHRRWKHRPPERKARRAA